MDELDVLQKMKRKKKVILCASFVIVSSLMTAAFLFFTMPLVWYDQQGRDLVTILEKKLIYRLKMENLARLFIIEASLISR